MVAVRGLVGLRPAPALVGEVTCPPYDVVKEGSPLHERLLAQPSSLVRVILGEHPQASLAALVESGALMPDEEPCFYVYEQQAPGQTRSGVFVAAQVSDYRSREIVRHEKTFDDKVAGRIALANATGHTIGPVFLLTRAKLSRVLGSAKKSKPTYEFRSDFGGGSDLHGIRNRVWRVTESSALGQSIHDILRPESLYIADGHHRYHAALRNNQTHVLAYVTEEARILAYDRVVNGVRSFADIQDQLDLTQVEHFSTPPKHSFCFYTRNGCWLMTAKSVPDDVVGGLDCSILERELYPHLEITEAQIIDPNYFDYYPESALDEMKTVVDRGDYELAIALHPVSIAELLAVADAGLDDANIVMPQKSTFFSPKILTGLFLYRHERHEQT